MRTQTVLGVTRLVRSRAVVTFHLAARVISWDELLEHPPRRRHFVLGLVMQNMIAPRDWIVASVTAFRPPEGT
jgi:hypothetical protein